MIYIKERIKNHIHTFGSITLSCVFCILLGYIICDIARQDTTLFTSLILIAAILILSIFIMFYYHYEYNRIGIERRKSLKYLKHFYWGISFLCFVLYMKVVYARFLKTYDKNIFGIDQGQYILLINFILFFCFAYLLLQIITGGFRIKNIGKNGIELERVIEDNSIEKIQNNAEVVSDIYCELGELDKVVDYLFSINKLHQEISEPDYLSVLQLLLSSLVEGKKDIKITLYDDGSYKEYLSKEVGLSNREIKVLDYKYTKYGIIKVENGLHIRYDYAPFHGFATDQTKYCYIVIAFREIYDIEIGKLIYAYIKVFEALYSKYILISDLS
ncbi:MAG: hypothetical protein Q4F05_09870 [bacterium]|nr:hypothetical protein [bacterium]